MSKPSGYWTFEKCQEEALKYENKQEFKNNCVSAYNSCLRNSWMEEMCSHMISKHKPNGYWTYDNCKEESLKYENRSQFKKLSNGAFDSSKRNNWLDDFYPKKYK
jgi:hypothetical protein